MSHVKSRYPIGECTIVVRDKDTEAVKRVQKEKNIVVWNGVNAVCNHQGIWLVPSGGTSTNHVFIGNRRCHADLFGRRNAGTVYAIGVLSPSGPDVQVIDKTISTPPYVQFLSRVDPGASVRTINIVGISYPQSAISNASIATYVNLGTPCIQSTTEVLDIYYRIQIVEESDPNAIPTPADADVLLAGAAAGTNISNGAGTWPAAYPDLIKSTYPATLMPTWTTAIPGPSLANYFALTKYTETDANAKWGNYSVSSFNWMRYGLQRSVMSLAIGDYVGGIAGSFLVGNAGSPGAGYVMAPATTKGFSPIQPIHNHNKNALGPFLDVSYLATGSGGLAFDSANWSNADFPELYRFDILQTGDVGASYYTMRKRCITGFNSNTYQSTGMNALLLADSSTQQAYEARPHHPRLTMRGSGGGQDSIYARNVKYNDTSMVTWDSTGVTIVDIKNNTTYDFDAASTPALNVTAVCQVAVDSSGNLWVADRSSGLYKITDPTGSPSIYHYTVATDSVPSDTNCYGVDVGYNDNVWAMFEGGLSNSSDGGTSWTNYNTGSSPAFSYTGITDGNWSTVQFLKVQKDSPDFRMGIMRSTAYNIGNVVWWSLPISPATQAVALPGPSINNGTYWDAYDSWFARTTMFLCSETGGQWSLAKPSNTSNILAYRCEFGTTSATLVNGPGGLYLVALAGWMSAACAQQFDYDRYGTPWWRAWAGGANVLAAPIATSYSGTNLQTNQYGNNIDYNASSWFRFGKGVYAYAVGPTDSGTAALRQVAPSSTQAGVQDLSLTSSTPSFATGVYPLNGRYTPREEFVWEQYGWNGAAWVKDYFTPAPDSSGNAYDAPRKNFNPESWVFTGRSQIDVSAAGVAGNFSSNQMTFACQVTPVDKTTPGQGTLDQVLLSSFDRGQFWQIVGGTTGAGGTWIVKGDATSTFVPSFVFGVHDNSFAAANTQYTVNSSSYNAGTDETTITVTGTINASALPEGWISGSIFIFYMKNNSGNMMVYDGTSTFSFGAYPNTIDGATTANIVLTVNGTAAHCYVDGTEVGAGVTMNTTFDWSNASGKNDIAISGLTLGTGGIGFKWAEEFFKGTMLNAILWDGVWTAGNVTDHNSAPLVDPSTYGGGVPTGTERARYQMNESLAGLETKATHSTYDDLINGLKNAFTAGVSSPHFYADPAYATTGLTDYYTVGVVDGILKDNATSFTYTTREYVLPVEHNFNTFSPATVPATTSIPTEKVVLRTNNESNSVVAGAPGEGPSSVASCQGYQNLTGDFTLTWTMEEAISGDPSGTYLRVAAGNSFNANSPSFIYELRFITADALGTTVVQAYYNGGYLANVVAGPTAWTTGDTFSIKRTGITFTAYKNGGLIYTWTTTSSATHYPAVSNSTYFTANDITITYDRAAYVVDVGDGSTTGKFDSRFFNIDGSDPTNVIDISFDEWTVTTIDYTTKTINVSDGTGAVASALAASQLIKLRGNTADLANKRYTVASATWDTVSTTAIVVNEVIPTAADNTGTVWKLASVHVPGITEGSYYDPIDALYAPGPYEVTLVPEAGHIFCNAAESGKTVYGALTIVYKKPL